MRDLRTLQPALVTTHNHLMWFSFAYGFRTNSGSFATLAAIRCASTVEAVNSDTSHVAGNNHTDNNSGYNIGTETPTHRYEHNLNIRKNKSPASSGLPVAQTERLYSGALHSLAT